MVRLSVTVWLVCSSLSAVFAQKWDVGVVVGATGYMGEINQTNPVLFTRGGGGITIRKNLNPDFSLKFAVTEALLHADDQYSGVPEQVQRNLRFTSWVTEASLAFEFNFFKFNPFDKRMSYSPYTFAGIGGFHFNPYTYLNRQKIFLNGVGTEGQLVSGPDRKSYYPSRYALNSICFPMGMGFKYHLSGHFSMNIEYGYRFTLTDYLDDIGGVYPDYTKAAVSSAYHQLSNRSAYPYKAADQRGDSWRYDKYFFGLVGLTYTFRSIDCPKFNQ